MNSDNPYPCQYCQNSIIENHVRVTRGFRLFLPCSQKCDLFFKWLDEEIKTRSCFDTIGIRIDNRETSIKLTKHQERVKNGEKKTSKQDNKKTGN